MKLRSTQFQVLSFSHNNPFIKIISQGFLALINWHTADFCKKQSYNTPRFIVTNLWNYSLSKTKILVCCGESWQNLGQFFTSSADYLLLQQPGSRKWSRNPNSMLSTHTYHSFMTVCTNQLTTFTTTSLPSDTSATKLIMLPQVQDISSILLEPHVFLIFSLRNKSYNFIQVVHPQILF